HREKRLPSPPLGERPLEDRPGERKGHASAEEQRKRVDAEQEESRHTDGADDWESALQQRLAKAEERLSDDGDDDRLDAIERPANLGKRAKANIERGQRQHKQHRRSDEADAT